MFYSEAILSRRGPLAKVWLAAHMERKLSKIQTLQTDIGESVDAIMGQEIEVMALRLSGQLLLGVVRIYSRKAKYLLDDCNEALLKIKMAFRPGIVDMTEDQLVVNRNAITLQDGGIDLDLLLPDLNWDIDFEDRPVQPQGQHVARMADITLATADDLQFDLDDPGYGFDLGPSDGIGSQDYEIDLGLDFGDGPSAINGNGRLEDDSMSVEVGRDRRQSRSPRHSLDSHLLGKGGLDGEIDLLSNRSRDPSEDPFRADFDFGPDLGMDLDLGLDFGEREKTPGQTRAPTSPLTEPPATPPPGVDLVTGAEAADQGATPKASPVKRKPKEKKQIVDSVTELQDGPGAKVTRGRNGGLGSQMVPDVSGILTESHFLPRSRTVMRLLEIRGDPLAHFLPTKVTSDGTFFCAAPPDLAPELVDLFMLPVQNHLFPKKRAGASPEKGHNKKRRLDGTVADDDEVEVARRGSSIAPSVGLGSDMLGRASIGPGLDGGFDFGDDIVAGMDDFHMDVDFGGGDLERARSKSIAESRLSTPPPERVVIEEGDESYADLTCPIAMFDIKTQSQTAEKEPDPADQEGKGYSKNTVKALLVIRKDLKPVVGAEGERMMSFAKMSEKGSRRAASSFFFELLVLGTRDCIKLSQSGPFENIEIRAKDKLWERQRHASVAPSVASGL